MFINAHTISYFLVSKYFQNLSPISQNIKNIQANAVVSMIGTEPNYMYFHLIFYGIEEYLNLILTLLWDLQKATNQSVCWVIHGRYSINMHD